MICYFHLNLCRRFAYFCDDRRGSTSLEFALNGIALMLFVFAIINLGDLGLVFGAMRHGVQGAARMAAVQTGVNISNSGSCINSAQVAGYFNNDASPVLPTASTSSLPGYPTVTTTWTNNAAGNTIQGTYVTVTASFLWVPIGMPNNSRTGIPLATTATDMVEGTSGASTSCS